MTLVEAAEHSMALPPATCRMAGSTAKRSAQQRLAVICQQLGTVFNPNIVDPGEFASQLYHITECTRVHLCSQLPGQDLSAVVVQHTDKIEPAPPFYFQVSGI